MRIVYLSSSAIPSRAANGIHLMRMCEALGKAGHDTALVGKQYDGNLVEDIYGYYGVEGCFNLALIPCKRVKGVGLLKLPKVYACLRQYDPKEVLVYARDIYGASVAIRMGFRVIYEAHGLPYNRLVRGLETTLFRHHRFLRLVAISKALRALYTSRYDVAEKVIVCHDAACMPNGVSNGDLPWPLCRDTLQIGYTGYLHPGRGIEVIAARNDATCTPAGTGPGRESASMRLLTARDAFILLI